MMVMLMGSSSSCYLLVGGGGFGCEAADVLSSLSGVSSFGFVSTQFVCMDCE